MGFLSDIFASILGAKISTDQQNAANDFNSTQAEINRNFQSYEAALNRDWQSREADVNRDFQSREAEVARIFNSNEAALQRDWSSQEAERARDWQEEMYAKYNSLSGKISQAEQAGVNPMFAITGNAVSPMAASSSAPSGASASGGAASGSSVGGAGLPSGSSASAALVDIVGSMLGMAKLRSEIDLNESAAELNRSESEVSLTKLAAEVRSLETSSDLNVQKALESVQNVENLKSSLNLTDKQAEAISSQIAYLNAQANYINAINEPDKRAKMANAEVAEWMNKNKQLFKSLDIGLEAAQTIADIGIGIFNAKTGANAPFVVPKDGQVYFPSDIVH